MRPCAKRCCPASAPLWSISRRRRSNLRSTKGGRSGRMIDGLASSIHRERWLKLASPDVLLEPLGDRVEVRRHVQDAPFQRPQRPALALRWGDGTEGGHGPVVAGDDHLL